MRRSCLKMFVLAGLTAVLTACGGGGGNALPSAVPSGSASGTVLDGLILNGTVTAYDFSNGTKGAVLGQATTDSNTGAYTLSLQVESRPVLLEITGGYYTEEAAPSINTNTVALDPTDKLTALIDYTTGAALTVSVTAYTHLAAGLAEYEIKTGVSVATAINDANQRVSQLAGLDIVHTTPLEITDIANASADTTPGLEYGFLAAAISEWVSNHAPAGQTLTKPYVSIKFDQLMHDDVAADGLLDGQGVDPTGVKIALSFGNTPLSPTVYRQGIGVSLLQIAAGSNNKTGLTPSNTNLLTYAEAYAGDADKMFNGVPPVSITAPSLAITQPSGSGWLRGSQLVTATVQDYAGLTSDSLTLDGNAAQVLTTNLTAPSWPLNTTTLSDGAHTATVSATNAAGITSTATMTFQVDNTPPSFQAVATSGATQSTGCPISGMVGDAGSGPTGTVSWAAWGTTASGSAALINNTFSFVIPKSAIIFNNNGGPTVNFSVNAADAAGNIATYSATLDAPFTSTCRPGSICTFTCVLVPMP